MIKFAFMTAVLAFAAAASPALAQDAWVQMTGAGAEVRVITAEAECPAARVDGQPLPLSLRAGPAKGFDNRICSAALPAGAKSVSVGDVVLAAPKAVPQRIVVIGDSGCRLTKKKTQACNSPADWPFAQVAALAAAQKPDLVIHVGDYYYRETACPEGDARCAGSPHGDKQATWDAEFFTPAQPLLRAAPWVLARGNHEICARGGAGWFRLLDAATPPKTCPEGEQSTFSVPIGGVDLVLVDSADQAGEGFAAEKETALFAARLDAMPAGRKWIITHRPVWYPVEAGPFNILGLFGWLGLSSNASEQAAVRGRPLDGVDMVLSGHVHNFTALSFGEARPAQWVIGSGGDVLDVRSHGAQPEAIAPKVDGRHAQGLTFAKFGYLVLDRDGDAWNGVFYDTHNAVIAKCRLDGRNLSCAAA